MRVLVHGCNLTAASGCKRIHSATLLDPNKDLVSTRTGGLGGAGLRVLIPDYGAPPFVPPKAYHS